MAGFEAAALADEDGGLVVVGRLVDERVGFLGDTEGRVHGFAPPEGVAARGGAEWFEDVGVGGKQFVPNAGTADVIVALLGGEDGGDEEDHKTEDFETEDRRQDE